MTVTPDAHREAARRFATGVTVAAAGHDGVFHAITATAFCSLSLDPPLVLLAVRSSSRLLDLVRGSGAVGISVLGAHQRHVGEWAAQSGRAPQRHLPLEDTVSAVTGSPLVTGSLAWFDCRVVSLDQRGDHHVVIGEVVAVGTADGVRDPLLYFSGGYHALGDRLHPRENPLAPKGPIGLDDERGLRG